jgi:L-fucose isomerase-like protein
MPFSFRRVRVGFVNLILDFLQGQDVAVRYSNEAQEHLRAKLGAEVVQFPEPVAKRDQASRAWKLFKAQDVDAVILFNGTFNTGELTAEIIRNLECPFALWGIGELALASRNFTGSMVGVLSAGALFKNFDKPFSFLYGPVSEKAAQRKLEVFVRAVRAIAYLREATIGVLGMRPDGFQIAGFDELAVKRLFGTEITKVSMYEFSNLIKAVDEKEIDRDMQVQKKIFDIPAEGLEGARGLSRVYLAVKKVAQERHLQSYAPDCWPELRDNDHTPICPANGRMNAEGVMASCECDVDGSLTLMMEYAMSGTTPWMADFVNLIRDNDTLLFWHCGNGPHDLSNGKPKIEQVFGGPAQVHSLKSGTATVCRLNSIRGAFTMHAGVGEVVESRPLLKGTNLAIRMKGGNLSFVESLLANGIPHHNAIVYGDYLEEMKEFASLMKIPCVIKE